MKLFPPRLALAVALVPTLYMGATQSMIHYSTRYISTSHSCLVLWRFDHSGFLMSMGPRAVPVLKKRIAEPNLDVGHKVHIAWQLGRMGDHTRFPILIQALAAPEAQHIAVMAIDNFPLQRQFYLPTILAQAKQPQPRSYWRMLHAIVYQSRPPLEKEALAEALAEHECGNRGLSAQEVRDLQQQFAMLVKPSST